MVEAQTLWNERAKLVLIDEDNNGDFDIDGPIKRDMDKKHFACIAYVDAILKKEAEERKQKELEERK